MGREVRRVPADWQHPKYEAWEGRESLKPLLDGCMYQSAHDDFIEMLHSEGLQAAVDYFGGAPDKNDYMPAWPEEQRTHYMMYEDTSEGTPISPAFATPEELARWLTDNNASAFAGQTASYEAWLNIARGGFAVSAVLDNGRLMSGLEFAASGTPTQRAETTGSVGEADGGPTAEGGDAKPSPPSGKQ